MMINRLMIAQTITHYHFEVTWCEFMAWYFEERHQNSVQYYQDMAQIWRNSLGLLTLLLLATPRTRPTSKPAAIRQVSVAVEVDALKSGAVTAQKATQSDAAENCVALTTPTITDPIFDEFRAIEIEMVRSGQYVLTTINGKQTLFPRRPMVIDCDDDGYSHVSGGLG